MAKQHFSLFFPVALAAPNESTVHWDTNFQNNEHAAQRNGMVQSLSSERLRCYGPQIMNLKGFETTLQTFRNPSQNQSWPSAPLGLSSSVAPTATSEATTA
jgi:hypothetical protein